MCKAFLKTLKDLKGIDRYEYDGVGDNFPFKHIGDLRESAIEWIKEIAKPEGINYVDVIVKSKDAEHYDCEYIGLYNLTSRIEEKKLAIAQIAWIKHFFNIIDKEVEEGYADSQDKEPPEDPRMDLD